MEENEDESICYPKAYMSGAEVGEVDLVIVFVKSTQTYEAVKQNKGLIGEKTLVMTLQNGAGNDRDILNFARKENIIIGTSQHNSVGKGPGRFKHTGAGPTTIGNMDTNSHSAVEVAKVLNESGLQTVVAEDIQRIIWSKLFVNLSINTLTALLETNIGYMRKNQYAWDFAKRIVYEAVEVAEADGTYFDRREALAMVEKVCIEHPTGYSSMYQDRKHKRLTEIDKINGAVVQQARLYGVPTPYNALIVDLIHAVEETYDER